MPNILDTIIAEKRAEVRRLRERRSQEELEGCAHKAPIIRDFLKAVSHGPAEQYRIVAEIKKASPSKGVIRENMDAEAIAGEYDAGGAAALSVLTDETYFQGGPENLVRARAATALPVLRKDFIIAPEQVWEARGMGADAILLIVAALGKEDLAALNRLAGELGMTALVEVHTAEELDRALDAGARCIGINNRDLTTFAVDVETTERLLPKIPADIPVISESGLDDAATLRRLHAAGASAFLIGEAFMKADRPGQALQDLLRGCAL